MCCGLKCTSTKPSQWDCQQPQHPHEIATPSFPMRSPISNTQTQPASEKVHLISVVTSRSAEKQWLHTLQLPLIRYTHTNQPQKVRQMQSKSSRRKQMLHPQHHLVTLSASKQASQNVFSSSCRFVESSMYFLRYSHYLYFLSKNIGYYRASICCFHPGCMLVSSTWKAPPQI